MARSQPKKVIRVGSTTTFSALVKKIHTTQGLFVYLLIDEKNTLLHSSSRIRLLKQEAHSKKKELVIISDDRDILSIAKHLSLRTRSLKAVRGARAVPEPAKHNQVSDIVSSTQRQSSPSHKKGHSLPSLPSFSVPSKVPKIKVSSLPKPHIVKPSLSQPLKKIEGLDVRKEYEKRFGSAQQIRLKDVRKYPSLLRGALSSLNRSTVFDIFSKLPFAYIAEKLFIAKVFRRLRGKRPNLRVIIIFSVIIITAFFFVAREYLPLVTVRVTPHTIEEVLTYDLTASANVATPDFDNNTIPAQILEAQHHESFTVTATGNEYVKSYAEGFIDIYNEYSPDPQVLVSNTRFIDEDAVIFRLVERVVVPGAKFEGNRFVESGKITALVRADAIGESFNIKPSSFVLPGLQGSDRYHKFRGKSTASMTGGFDGERRVVTQQDKDEILKKAREEMFPIVQEDLHKRIPSDLYVVHESSPDFANIEWSADVGEPAEHLTADITVSSRAFVIHEEHAERAFAHYASQQEQKEYEGYEQGAKREINYVPQNPRYGERAIHIVLEVVQSFRKIVDIEALKHEIVDKRDIEVKNILEAKKNNNEFQKVNVRFWPFWVKTVPSDTNDIKIEFDYVDMPEDESTAG